MDKPDVDVIEGLSPAISIEQKATSHNPRSTVGTVTEIHDYLRLLYARAGTPYCPNHDLPLQAQSVSQMVDATLGAAGRDAADGARAGRARPQGRVRRAVRATCRRRATCASASTARPVEAADVPKLKKAEKHDIDVVIDRVKVQPRRARSTPSAAHAAAPAPRRKLRGGAAHRRRARHRGRDGRRPRAPVLEQVRLPDLQLLAARARAAPVLVQFAGRRLPDLRRPRPSRRCSTPSASSPFRR